MNVQNWTSLPILDALRPETGWKTDHAVFGSYSADPVALVAILLALAGRDDDRGSGSAVDFAEAFEALRGKVTFLIQCGRLSVPFRGQTVLKLLDNFIREVHCDEDVESWHPKVALVRQSMEKEDEICWRFWLGSRNFTRDRSWDAGLLLVGNVEDNGKIVPGLIETARELWSMVGLTESASRTMGDELSHVRWSHPPGCKVEEIQLLLPQATGRGLPATPRRIESLLVVSPFLDGGTVETLGQWPSPENCRALLSTHRALSGIATQKNDPLSYFRKGQILYMDDFDEDESLAIHSVEESSEEISEDATDDHVGLHAKLILVRRKGQNTLWLGSPNVTKRAWEKNYEIVARLSIQNDLVKGLLEFAKKANEFVAGDLKSEPISRDQEAIDLAHQQVVSRWQVKQKDWTLHTKTPPHPDNPDVKMEVGILGGELVLWPRKANALKLSQGNPAIETELVQVRISLGTAERRWLQKAPLNPPAGVDRDRQAVATLFSPNSFLKWLRTLLEDDLPPGDGTWDQPDRKTPRRKSQRLQNSVFPTLENILKAWSRNPEVLKTVDIRLKTYMEFICKSSPEEEKEMIHLKEFETVWKTVRAELLEE